MIAGDHNRPDSGFSATGNGLTCLGPRRIAHPHEGNKNHVRLCLCEEIIVGTQGSVGEGKDPEGLICHGSGFLSYLLLKVIGEGHRSAVFYHAAAAGQDGLIGSFTISCQAMGGGMHRRHLLAFRTEGNLLDSWLLASKGIGITAAMRAGVIDFTASGSILVPSRRISPPGAYPTPVIS